MTPEIPETINDITETINGVTIVVKPKKTTVQTADVYIRVDIDLLDLNNNFLRTRYFRGKLSSTVAEIKAVFQQPVDIFICDEKKSCILENDFRPFLECYEIRDRVLNPSTKRFIKAKVKAGSSLYSFNEMWNVRNLRKLIIYNHMIAKIDLSSFKYLRYLKLINNGLVTVIPPNRILEFCDMRDNFLKECTVMSKVLILQNNQIERFKSTQKFRYLNLSLNPLKSVVCSCSFLNIRNTFVPVIDSNAKIILADDIEKIRIGKCPNLEILYVNNCKITHIGSVVGNLILLKARNNYFQSLPRFHRGRVIDVSGNFLENVNGTQLVQFLNISKNQVRQIDMKRFPNIQHIDLSFNPLEKVYNEGSIQQPSSVIVNFSLHSNFTLLKSKSIKQHSCKKSNHHITQYKLNDVIASIPISIFVFVKSRILPVHHDLFRTIFNKFRYTSTYFDMLSEYSDDLFKRLSGIDNEVSIGITFITNTHVYVRSFFLPMFFANFSEMDILVDPDTIRVFNNVSNWCVWPVLCRYTPLAIKRVYSLFRGRANYTDLLQFNNFSCPITLEFFINNKPEFFVKEEPSNISSEMIKTVYLKSYSGDFEKTLQEVMSRQNTTEDEVLGLQNINFNMASSIADSGLTNISTRNPVFLYMKLYFESKSSHILMVEELNVLHVVEFYSQAFEGKMIEKNYTFFIIGFDDPLRSALFGLRIQKVLKSIGIEVGVGIAEEAVFRTEQDGIVYFGGPVFNKASRIAELGTGIFCCRCVKFSSPLIEIFDEGERYLKGFHRRHRIFSLKLVKEREADKS